MFPYETQYFKKVETEEIENNKTMGIAYNNRNLVIEKWGKTTNIPSQVKYPEMA